VFVPPDARGRGIASALVRAIEARAAALGIGRLYLFTTNKVQLYARLGWTSIERREYQGKPIAVMARDLSTAAQT
jgi:N-acetylglutamate synthase-like GNAT family acetyltransferase